MANVGKLSSVLIANRGEIACRIIRTAKRLGLRTIAVYSEVDSNALFVRQADEAFLLGPAPASESYLAIEKIIERARRSGASCIHPGYGFLSERAEFAEACRQQGIVFVGPPASAIRAMGLKDAAKTLVQAAGVPVVPGYHGARQETAFLREQADAIGYPVLIKAVAGGGGRGMRRVDKPADFEMALQSAAREAQNAFGDARVLIEKYVASPRHIEVQIFADSQGNTVHLFERDCSLQRRHQKVIEEAPAPGMTAPMREAMGRAAVEAARSVGYVGAGTVEFIVDGRDGLQADRFYFMEMNTRLQVEHPVTEAITGLDLVELQFRIAAGEALPFRQQDLHINGHAVEARLYAEDPEHGFLPSTGKLWALQFPAQDNIRVDTGVEAGAEVSPYYDPLIAKLIAHGPTRETALGWLAAALGQTLVAGPKTNTAFLKALCEAPAFQAGHFDTGFIERNLATLGAVAKPPEREAVEAGTGALVAREVNRLAGAADPNDPWSRSDGFQLMGARELIVPIEVDGEAVNVTMRWPETKADMAAGDDRLIMVPADDAVFVVREGRQVRIALRNPFAFDPEHADDAGTIRAPMHGRLVAVFVKPGDRVEKGQRLAIVEAMKMEHLLIAPFESVVAEVSAEPGAQVVQGARLIAFEA